MKAATINHDFSAFVPVEADEETISQLVNAISTAILLSYQQKMWELSQDMGF